MLEKIVKQASWSIFGSVFSFSVGFFVKLFLIRTVGTEAFGQYMIGQTVVSTVQVFIAFAIPQTLLRFVPAFLEKKEYQRANNLASVGIQCLLVMGSITTIVVMLFHNQIAQIFPEGNSSLSYIIMLSAFYVPLTLYMTALNTAYRTLLKIKEIVLYGTFWMVSIRAVLTFVVFSFIKDVSYFIFIELVSTLIVLLIMTVKFDFSRLSFWTLFPYKSILEDRKVVTFGKKMYFYSLVGFAGGYTITLIVSTTLPASEVGVYTILITLSGLSAFLLNNLNSVFAPMISKLHAAGEKHQLELLFKDTTFIINLIAAPFIVLLVLFSNDILSLYAKNLALYVVPLVILMLGSYINLFTGSSGVMLLMRQQENDQIRISLLNVFVVILMAINFIPKYGLLAAIWINTGSAIAINLLNVFFVKRRFSFTPWGASSAIMFIMTVSVIGYVGWFNPVFSFRITDYIWISLLTLMVFWLPFLKKIIRIIRSIQQTRYLYEKSE